MLMQGKKGLIMGVANDKSIAWGIAKAIANEGGEIALTYQGDALKKRVGPLAESINSDILIPCDVSDSESMQNSEGEEVSTREIKRILQDTIGVEDKRKPLTDEKLAEVLKQKGYPIARRTVAKYREQLSIPVGRLRKEI